MRRFRWRSWTSRSTYSRSSMTRWAGYGRTFSPDRLMGRLDCPSHGALADAFLTTILRSAAETAPRSCASFGTRAWMRS
ncbi:hypothetical protein ABZ883_03125 [Streptomyces sp. NPDC046977]|uniref:hypothetical protein n=1 Tax=Streptomyces sp. NPDC046977 TaxID=3154703 RepID=UPI0033EA7BC8